MVASYQLVANAAVQIWNTITTTCLLIFYHLKRVEVLKHFFVVLTLQLALAVDFVVRAAHLDPLVV